MTTQITIESRSEYAYPKEGKSGIKANMLQMRRIFKRTKGHTRMKYPMLHQAVLFATDFHSCQDRKYSGLPYIVHPMRVMTKVREVTGDENMLCAAVLHDVVEDTQATLKHVNQLFGPDISTLVEWLTDTAKPEDGNRAQRKAIELSRLAKAPAAAQTIKLADLIDNASSITKADPGFAKVYMREKEDLLKALTKGSKILQAEAWDLVDIYRNIERLRDQKVNPTVKGHNS